MTIPTKAPRRDIYSHVGMADPVVVTCYACNTTYHTVTDDLAEAWLLRHQCPVERTDMATAGPGNDQPAVEITQHADGWLVQCAECRAQIAQGEREKDDVSGRAVQEAIRAHKCGTRTGRITED